MENQHLTTFTNTWIELRSIRDAGEGERWRQLCSLLACWRNEARGIAIGAWRITKANRRLICILALSGVCLLCAMMPHDREWLSAIRHHKTLTEQAHIRATARFLSYWGDFAGFNLLVFGTLCCFAFVRRSPFFRRMTLAAVMGTLLTGGVANVMRVTTGRARPGSGLAPGFYGPSLSAKKQSFPSAHTATSFGASVPVAVAFPPAGVPMIIVSGAVAWSRMENNSHHPSDVLTSVMISCLFGIPLGLVIRRQRRARNSLSDQQQHFGPTEAGHVEALDGL